MAKIAVDIDDTLYSFSNVAKDALFHLAHERDDKEILRAAYTETLQWRTPADVSPDNTWIEAIQLAHQPEVIASQPAYPGAAETLRALKYEGHELIFISNRSEEATEATDDWLVHNDFPIDDDANNLVCLMGDKIPYLSDCQYIIDDRVSTLVRFVYDDDWKKTNGERRRGFGIHASHNTNLTDVPGVYLAPSWAGLNYYFVRKGLLSEPAYRPFGKELAYG